MPLVLDTHDNSLVLTHELNANIVNSLNGFPESESKKLVLAALEAANRSHAPYSACPSGVALMDLDGKIYKGSYMESAAYNPSMGPAQAAVVAFLAAGGGGEYERIVRAVLVEKEGELVRQEETVRFFFKAVSPKCEVSVFHCKISCS